MSNVDTMIVDWANPPGATISRLLEKRGVALQEFGDGIGISGVDVNRLLEGQLAIDSLIAQELSSSLGGSVGFWLKRESDYREAVEKSKEMEPQNWARQFPTREMKSWGWINKSDGDLASLLAFFDVESPRAWYEKYQNQLGDFAFRKVEGASRAGHITAWLRRAELMAAPLQCKKWDADKFRAALQLCKPLSYERDPAVFIPSLQRICSSAGVAVVVVRSPTGTGVSGATRFITPSKAVLCLSLRHLADDHLWFTFFHEAGHLLLHKKSATFLETDSAHADQQEREADQFARDVLVPRHYRARLIAAKNSRYEIARLAKQLDVSPGILVGQLQKDGLIPYNRMNYMKRKYQWPSLET